MNHNKQDDESRLGHDPLEWLEDDETVEEESSSTPVVESQQPEPVEEPASEAELQKEEHTEEVETAELEPEPASDPEEDLQTTLEISKFSNKNGVAKLFLPDRMMVQIIEALHTEWKAIVKTEQFNSIHINAGQVEDIDAAGIQLLFVFVRQLTSNGCQVALEDVPDNLENVFVLAGLTDYFKAFIHAA